MDIFHKHAIKMYYVPNVYYWVDNDNIYKEVKSELYRQYEESKLILHRNIKNNKLIEKTPDYIQYKSNLIRLILVEFAHDFPNKKGKDLLSKIFDKWNEKISIKLKIREMIYNRTIDNITKNEKIINNIEEIMMLINLKMLENYYE
jgi:hypothetical protein